jgi:hypothetical protein
MNSNFHIEKIDAYLKNQLSEHDQKLFEQLIEQDPLLKGELQLQSEIVEAICEHRKTELKHRLNNVQVEPTPILYLPKTTFVGTIVAASLLTGVLVFFDSQEKSNQKKNNPIVANVPKVQEYKTESRSNTIEKAQTQTPTPTTQSNPVTVNTLISDNNTVAKPTQEVSVPTRQATLRKENILPTLVKTNLKEEGKTTLKVINIQNITKEENVVLDIERTDSDNGVYDRMSEDEISLEHLAARQRLKYQFYNNQLFLYNANSVGKKLQLEVNGKKRHFLYYEGDYYEFYENQMTETEMKIVQDSRLISFLIEITQKG